MYDLKISGGLLVDGTGEPPRHADVGVVGDKIVAQIYDEESADATTVLRLYAPPALVAATAATSRPM